MPLKCISYIRNGTRRCKRNACDENLCRIHNQFGFFSKQTKNKNNVSNFNLYIHPLDSSSLNNNMNIITLKVSETTPKLKIWILLTKQYDQMCLREEKKTKQVCDSTIHKGYVGLGKNYVLTQLQNIETVLYYAEDVKTEKIMGFALVKPQKGMVVELTVLCTLAPGAKIANQLLDHIAEDYLDENKYILHTKALLIAEKFYIENGFSYTKQPCRSLKKKTKYCDEEDRKVINDQVQLYKCLEPVSSQERKMIQKQCHKDNKPDALEGRFPDVSCKSLRKIYLP